MQGKTSARPTKNFFVNLFTKDIDLEGAIFDLIDNSIDGAARNASNVKSDKKYSGKWINILISGNTFSITDNCGGIPENLIPYAFRFGRPEERPEEPTDTVGIYGIGMKRSMYRMGTSGRVVSRNAKREYKVHFSEEWTKDDNNWDLPIIESKGILKEEGTSFVVEKLRPSVASEFSDPDFIEKLIKSISVYYAYIIKSGLKLTVNDISVPPLDISLYYDKELTPHVFELKGKNVAAFGVIGIRPGKIIGDDSGHSNNRDHSGITIICNDRVVLHSNKDWKTGWGESPVPHFHNQFIGISGVVNFSGKADALPMATDKRTIDLNSDIFAAAKVSIKKGIKKFTDMTNKWKGNEKTLRSKVSSFEAKEFREIQRLSSVSTKAPLKKTTTLEKLFDGSARESHGSFPAPPKKSSTEQRITFSVDKGDYQTVAEYLFPDIDPEPPEVGRKCFENQLVRSSL